MLLHVLSCGSARVIVWLCTCYRVALHVLSCVLARVIVWLGTSYLVDLHVLSCGSVRVIMWLRVIMWYVLYSLSGCIGKVVDSHAVCFKVARSNPGCDWVAPIYTMHKAIRGYCQLVLPMRVGGATSQLDLTSLTPLSVAGCGRLQLGVPHWATLVTIASSW